MKYHFLLLFFFRKLRKVSQNLSSAAVMIGALLPKIKSDHNISYASAIKKESAEPVVK